MGASKRIFMDLRELMIEDDLLEIMTEEEYREDLHNKYGYSTAYTAMLQNGETNDQENF